MPGTDGGGGTLDGGRPGELIPDRRLSNCVLGDDGTTIYNNKNNAKGLSTTVYMDRC